MSRVLTDREYTVVYWLAVAEAPLLVGVAVLAWPLGLTLITLWAIIARDAARIR